MNATSIPIQRGFSWSSFVWKTTLILIPIITAGFLLWLRHVEVRALAQRTVSSYGGEDVVPLRPDLRQHHPDVHAHVTSPPFGDSHCPVKKELSSEARNSAVAATSSGVPARPSGVCPMISMRMSELQKPLEKTDVHLVSFSIDPEKDTPEVLRGYAEKLHAEPKRWDFLTGRKSAIYNLSHNDFKLAVSDGSDEAGIPVHSTRMVLVDRHGEIRGYYEATDADAVTKLLADTSHLLREQPK